jgi:hypothetical protein
VVINSEGSLEVTKAKPPTPVVLNARREADIFPTTFEISLWIKTSSQFDESNFTCHITPKLDKLGS